MKSLKEIRYDIKWQQWKINALKKAAINIMIHHERTLDKLEKELLYKKLTIEEDKIIKGLDDGKIRTDRI